MHVCAYIYARSVVSFYKFAQSVCVRACEDGGRDKPELVFLRRCWTSFNIGGRNLDNEEERGELNANYSQDRLPLSSSLCLTNIFPCFSRKCLCACAGL